MTAWRTLQSAAGLIGFVLFWEVMVRIFAVPEYIMPAPSLIVSSGLRQWSTLLWAAFYTSQAMIIGFLVAVAAGLIIAIAIAFSASGRALLYPLLVVLQIVPKIAVAPLFIIWFGFGMLPKVLLVWLMSFFPVVVAAMTAFSSIEPEIMELARSTGAGRLRTFRMVQLPQALPTLFGGIKVGGRRCLDRRGRRGVRRLRSRPRLPADELQRRSQHQHELRRDHRAFDHGTGALRRRRDGRARLHTLARVTQARPRRSSHHLINPLREVIHVEETAAAAAATAGPVRHGFGQRRRVAAAELYALRLPYAHLFGVEHGIYKKHGIDLTVGEGKGSASTVQIVGAGGDTFGISDSSSIINGVVKGAPIRAVMSLTNHSPYTIAVRKDAGITNFKDLAGKTIAANTGEAPLVLLPAVLESQGMAPDSINVLRLDPAAKMVAVLQNQAVGMLAGLDNQSLLLPRKGAEVVDFAYAELGVNTIGLTIQTNQSTIDSNPDLVKRFVQATQESYDAAKAEPDASIAAGLKVKPDLDADLAKAQLEAGFKLVESPRSKGKPIGVMVAEDWDDTLALLKKYQGLETDKTATDFWTDQFTK